MPKTLRPLFLLAAIAALILTVAGCGGSDVPSDSVAKVGDAKITKAQFNHWFPAAAKQQAQSTGQKPAQVAVPDPPNFTKCIAAKQKAPVPKGVPKPDPKALKAQCNQEYTGLRDQTLQFLISSQWLTQEAAKRKITASDKEVQTTFQQQKKQSFPKDADYQKFLQTSGQSETDLLYRVKLSVLTNKLQQSIVKDKAHGHRRRRSATTTTRTSSASPSPRRATSRSSSPPRSRRPRPRSRRSSPARRGRRSRRSTPPTRASKSQGGKLPGVTKGQQEKTFDAAIFSAKKGKVLGPIKTQFGFYVFSVTKITPAKQQTLAQVKTTIKNLLQSQGQQKALNDFVKDFQKRYKDMTNCAKGYVVDQCKNAPKKKTTTTPVSGGTPQTGGTPQQVPQTGTPQQDGRQTAPQQAPPGGGTDPAAGPAAARSARPVAASR